MNENGVIHSSSIRPITKKESQIRINDEPVSDNWNDYILHVGKVTMYDDNLVFKKSGKFSH